MTKPLWIELVNTGIANRFESDDHELIELNWRLTKYPDLYAEVMKHELSHDDKKSSIEDIIYDMTSRTPGLFKFMRNHLSAWTQVLPIYWDSKRKSIIRDNSMIVSWIVLLCITSGLFYFLRWLL